MFFKFIQIPTSGHGIAIGAKPTSAWWANYVEAAEIRAERGRFALCALHFPSITRMTPVERTTLTMSSGLPPAQNTWMNFLDPAGDCTGLRFAAQAIPSVNKPTNRPKGAGSLAARRVDAPCE